MAYPARPSLKPLAAFKGTATSRPTPEHRQRLLEFVAREYRAGRSLRELAELTDRTQAAVRRALDQAEVPRRGPGARKLTR